MHPDYRRFYLKNIAPVFRGDTAHLPWRRFLSYLFKSGEGWRSAWKSFRMPVPGLSSIGTGSVSMPGSSPSSGRKRNERRRNCSGPPRFDTAPPEGILPLDGEPLLLRVMEALSCIPADEHILACPEDSYGTFKTLAERAGFAITTGPKDDVLRRFVLAIEAFKLDYCIRATADNPFVFADAAWLCAQETLALEADYGTLTSMPYGSGVELIRPKPSVGRTGKASHPMTGSMLLPTCTTIQGNISCIAPWLPGHGGKARFALR